MAGWRFLLTRVEGHQYRFGFVLTTAAGNRTRYLNLRKYAERDTEVESVWAPISHYPEPDFCRALPNIMRTRLYVSKEARPVMGQLNDLDAVMYHAFEPYAWACMRHLFYRKPILVWSQDNPPVANPALHPKMRYGGAHTHSIWRTRLRYLFDRWCARRTSLFVPFSKWAGEVLTGECQVPAEFVHPVNVGLDLEFWKYYPVPPDQTARSKRIQILFVGMDFQRKGGDLLLEVFRNHFADRADLHLVTGTAPDSLPSNTQVYSDFGPADPRLRELYKKSDIFVLPTRADMSPWVVMEAMATGRPVIASDTGGIPDIVQDGKTGFLIPIEDTAALKNRIETLIASPELRSSMGASGRKHIESEFNAAVCVPKILEFMKQAVDRSKSVQKAWSGNPLPR